VRSANKVESGDKETGSSERIQIREPIYSEIETKPPAKVRKRQRYKIATAQDIALGTNEKNGSAVKGNGHVT